MGNTGRDLAAVLGRDLADMEVDMLDLVSDNKSGMELGRELGMAGLGMAGLGMAGLGMTGLGMAGLGMAGLVYIHILRT